MRRLLVPSLFAALAAVIGLVLFGATGPSSAAATPRAQHKASSSSAATTKSAKPTAPGAVQIALGKTLFNQTCATCHGVGAAGSSLAPNLRGVGAATVHLWVSSGWMPLANPTAQPSRKPSEFNEKQTRAIANYIGSLTPGQGTPIPTVNLKGANLTQGFSLFALNCAPCHTITGAGDALSNGLSAPTLHGVTPLQVTEAVLTGPGNMPHFVPGALTRKQVNDVVAYVESYIQRPEHPGGFALGGVGPVAEGFIGLFVGVGACMLVGYWIGERTRREDLEAGHDDGDHDGSGVQHEGAAHA